MRGCKTSGHNAGMPLTQTLTSGALSGWGAVVAWVIMEQNGVLLGGWRVRVCECRSRESGVCLCVTGIH